MMNKYKLTDTILFDYVRIFADEEIEMANDGIKTIRSGFIVTKIITEYDPFLTFEDCLNIAKENGFTKGVFYIMAEKPLRGVVYQYANCYEGGEMIFEHGETRGYA